MKIKQIQNKSGHNEENIHLFAIYESGVGTKLNKNVDGLSMILISWKKIFYSLQRKRFLKLFSVLILPIFHCKLNIVVSEVSQNFKTSVKALIGQ